MNVINVIGGALYQWDTGRKIRIDPPEGTVVSEVHFAYARYPDALNVYPETVDGVVTAGIPSEILQYSGAFIAYAVMVTEDGRQTMHSRGFSVIARAKPDDYVYTEEDVRRYETLVQRLDEIEDSVVRGTGILKVSSGPESYNTEIDGFKPSYRMELTTICSEAMVDNVLVGDVILRGYYYYNVGYIDETYAYLSNATYIAFSPTVTVADIDGGRRVTIKDINGTSSFDVMDGEDGADGKDGEGKAWLIGSTTEITPTQVLVALQNEQNVMISYTSDDTGAITFSNFTILADFGAVYSSLAGSLQPGNPICFALFGTLASNEWSVSMELLASGDQIPTKLPNPHELFFNDSEGNCIARYDGTGDVTVEIPAAVQADWGENDESSPAYVQGRTHWLERPYEPIVWDGSTEGRDSVDLSLALGYPAGSVIAYKISDHVLSKDALASANITDPNYQYNQTTTVGEITEFVPDAIWAAEFSTCDDDGGVVNSGNIICASTAGDFSSSLGVVIPSVGTYCLKNHSGTIRIDGDNLKKIDEVFLPDFAEVAKTGSYNSLSDTPTIYDDPVRYTPQINITEEQRHNARNNIGVFSEREIKSIIFSLMCGIIEEGVFSDADEFKNADHFVSELITEIREHAFSRNSTINSVVVPRCTYVDDNAFEYCYYLLTADLTDVTNINREAFYFSGLTALVLRGNALPSLGHNALHGTPIAEGIGYIYVPRALIEEYKVATNWSTYAAQFRALEDYTVDGTTTGDLDESKI